MVCKDGVSGYAAEAPYDVIYVEFALPDFPKPLIDQLAVNGILVLAVGQDKDYQSIYRITKKDNCGNLEIEDLM